MHRIIFFNVKVSINFPTVPLTLFFYLLLSSHIYEQIFIIYYYFIELWTSKLVDERETDGTTFRIQQKKERNLDDAYYSCYFLLESTDKFILINVCALNGTYYFVYKYFQTIITVYMSPSFFYLLLFAFFPLHSYDNPKNVWKQNIKSNFPCTGCLFIIFGTDS